MTSAESAPPTLSSLFGLAEAPSVSAEPGPADPLGLLRQLGLGGSAEPPPGQRRRKRARRNPVWAFFSLNDAGSAFCRQCPYFTKSAFSTNLKIHLKSKHADSYQTVSAGLGWELRPSRCCTTNACSRRAGSPSCRCSPSPEPSPRPSWRRRRRVRRTVSAAFVGRHLRTRGPVIAQSVMGSSKKHCR